MRLTGLFSKVSFDRVLLTAIVALVPITAGSGSRLDPPPPTPQFVAVPSSGVHVIATWGAGAHMPQQPSDLYAPAGDTTLLSKSAGAPSVASNGTLHYSVAITNATNATQTFHLTDTLPASVSFVDGSATGGFVYEPSTSTLTAIRTLSAFQGNVTPAAGAPLFIDIGIVNNPSICQQYFSDCDDDAITLAGVPYRYLGVDYTSITLDSNGFVMPGSGALGADDQNQHLPDPTLPNTVIAPFWDELDLNGSSSNDLGGGDWFYGVEHDNSSNADYLVVEWRNAQKEGDASSHYSFEVWIQLHTEHITFAYGVLTGNTSSATIGFENSDGTLGHSYLYSGAGPVPGPNTNLQIIANYATLLLGYDVKARPGLAGCRVITNAVNLSNGPGTLTRVASADTAVFGPCRFLPIVGR